MNKLFMTGLFFFVIFCFPVAASELTEDYFDMATNYVIQGNYVEAVSFLDKILVYEPQNSNVADLKRGLEQILKGRNFSFVLSKSNSVKQAVEAKKNGNMSEELSILAAGKDYWAYYFFFFFYRNRGSYTQAVDYFIKSVNAKPDFVQCYLQIALCYFEAKNYTQSITYLNQYLKINQQDDFAYALRARCEAALDNTNDALSDVITAIALENSLEHRFLEAKILYNMRRYAQACEKLEKLAEEIQTSEVYKLLGYCQAELGRNSDAIINLEKAMLLLFEDDKNLSAKYNELKAKI